MTAIDLRIKYKSETGEYPTYGRYTTNEHGYKSGAKTAIGNYQGGLTHEYAEWLECYAKKTEVYRMDVAEYGTYKDKRRITRYTSAYKEWLENLLCETLSISALENLK